MQNLAMQDLIEAYALPAGVISGMLRESGARRPGFITKVGLGSFVDPRKSGGKLNAAAVDDIVEIVEFHGEKYLRYLPQKVNVGIIRGSTADKSGNISFEEEPAFLDSFAVALAARGSGGKVFVQVKNIVPNDFYHSHKLSIEIMSLLCDQRYLSVDISRLIHEFKSSKSFPIQNF
jgi:acyl CoA:acetate/3-ketoacid CoA transferase